MTMPNFLIVGAAKSGSSSLHFYLAQHPEIYMTPKKQTYFFASEGAIPNFRGPGDHEEVNKKAITSLDVYQREFNGVTTEKAIGEACSVYMYDDKAPERIKHHVPNAKLIMILRDPVERAYSSFMQLVRDGYETTDDFEQGLALEATRIKDNYRHLWHYKKRGLYYEQIQHYLTLFEESQIHICFFEDLKNDPQHLLRGIYRFLGVDDSFVADTSGKYNATGIPRSRALLRLIMQPNAFKSVAKTIIPESVRKSVKTFVTTHPLALRKPPASPRAREKLVPEFREDILKLQALTGRDLSRWLQ